MIGVNSALKHYEDALKSLDKFSRRKSRGWFRGNLLVKKRTKHIKEKRLQTIILRILRSRDMVQSVLVITPQTSTVTLSRLMELDDRLRHHADLIVETVYLKDWRETIRPDEQAWWWSLETVEHKHTRSNWIWNFLITIVLTISLSLAVAISTRFLSGGPDVLGALAIVGQAVLTLITAGTLTSPGRKVIEQLFYRLRSYGLKRYHWQKGKFILSVVSLVILFIFWTSLPKISNFFNSRGLDYYIAGELANARFDFERSVSLDPNNLPAHYNLGRLNEDIQQLDKALVHYQIAAQGDYSPAYNELGRIELKANKLPESAAMLIRGLELSENLPEGDEQNHTTYALLKNLGWVRFKQKRNNEAEILLKEAISYDNEFSNTPAAAHCLLAQVLEKLSPPKNSKEEWESCQAFLIIKSPEEDTWYYLAQQRTQQP